MRTLLMLAAGKNFDRSRCCLKTFIYTSRRTGLNFQPNVKQNKNSHSYSKGAPADSAIDIPSVSSKPNSKCSVSRVLCIQGLIILFLLTLAAVIIPIVVLVMDTTNRGSPCATTYSQSFVYNTIPTTQCAAWQTFTSTLTCTKYTLLLGLRYNTTISATSNGVNWRVGSCWWSVPGEITTDIGVVF
ncbi:unnamed protein product [Adineta ricciae]|uniref:Uncharacterized protein n=1 Tax=Adineta ricciae TaxID=249248 RepID=A0A815LZ12_ADIRI|nr:unnamed protein product [Adineta ricciae]